MVKNPVLTIFILLAAGLCLGLLSLWVATGGYYIPMFLSYLEHPVLAVLNLMPVVLLALFLYFALGRAWVAFLVSGSLVMLLTFVSYYKLAFRNDPLMFEDILL
jgi:hypothetical protein